MGVDATEIIDATKDVAGMIYNRGTGLAAHALAIKIFNSGGEVDLDENEINLIEQVFSAWSTPVFLVPVLAAIGREPKSNN